MSIINNANATKKGKNSRMERRYSLHIDSSKSSQACSKKLSLSWFCISLNKARSSSLTLRGILPSKLWPLFGNFPPWALSQESALARAKEASFSLPVLHLRTSLLPAPRTLMMASKCQKNKKMTYIVCPTKLANNNVQNLFRRGKEADRNS